MQENVPKILPLLLHAANSLPFPSENDKRANKIKPLFP
jgi:hypothetical protein